MKNLVAIVFAVVGSCLIAQLSSAREGNPKCHGDDIESQMECRVLELLNDYRTRKGRSKLKIARQCYQMAKSHARTMRKFEKMSHAVVRGQDPDQRANRFGLGKMRTVLNKKSQFRYNGENIARYYSTPEDAMRSWRWSLSGHNANMLRRSHTHVGVGLAIGRDRKGLPRKGQYYWVQVFCIRK